MSATEFEFILAAIEFLATYGQRFLPLYSFNWKTGGWTFRKSAVQRIVGEEQALALNRLKLGGRGLVRHDRPPATPLSQKQDSDGHGGMENKYAMYLETALYVAKSLPRFPEQRRVPDGVDVDLILFRI